MAEKIKSDGVAGKLVDNFAVLPESVRYAMKYAHGHLGKNEIDSLLYSVFGLTGLYALMKYYAEDIDSLIYILSVVCTDIYNPTTMYSILRKFHNTKNLDHEIALHKIATLGRYGFASLDKYFDTIVEHINVSQKTPICILNAGILGLSSLLKNLDGNDIILFDPNHIGRIIYLHKKGAHWGACVTNTIHSTHTDYILLDDVISTGANYKKVSAALEEYGLFDLDILAAVDLLRGSP